MRVEAMQPLNFEEYKQQAYKKSLKAKWPREKFIDLMLKKYPQYGRSHLYYLFYKAKEKHKAL